ncbi:flagellar biosynthetic protein FliO [Acidithiobacillus sp.]|jgi:flagellar protein FliO/FliZ|uniref:flagellar biosynthetic protein FliO n=1 Tax=Acidithiobacillus sp. TaxID=1872118 RepID=UPI00260D4CBB|nr:flagellar biosynthetic protein FliO [Acidithiobacillus sp.]
MPGLSVKVTSMGASKIRLTGVFLALWSPTIWADTSTGMGPESVFSWSAILQLFSALILVLLLFFGVIWLLKHLQPGLASGQLGGMRVVSSLPLGTRERLLLVQVGEQQLLLGVTPAGITLLHTLETVLPDTTSNAPAAFAGWLRSAMERRKQGPWNQFSKPPGGDPAAPPPASGLPPSV